MAKEPKPNFSSFTKTELIKTVKKLDARQTKLLNEIADWREKWEASQAVCAALMREAQNAPYIVKRVCPTCGTPDSINCSDSFHVDLSIDQRPGGVTMFPWEKK